MGPVGVGASYSTCRAGECSTQLVATCRVLITTPYHKNLRLREVMPSRGGHTAGQRQGQSWSRASLGSPLSSHLGLTSSVALTPPTPPRAGVWEDGTLPGWLGPKPSAEGMDIRHRKHWPGFPMEAEGGALETPGANGNQVPEVGAGSWGAAREGWCAGSPTVLAPQHPEQRQTRVSWPQRDSCRDAPGPFLPSGPWDGVAEALLRMSHFFNNLNEVRFNFQIHLPGAHRGRNRSHRKASVLVPGPAASDGPTQASVRVREDSGSPTQDPRLG